MQLYLAGKGDGNIRYYEIVDEAPYMHYLNQFLSGHPQKAVGFMPKRGLNTSICEIFRFYKLHATGNICEPIAMIVPRKSTVFQSDIYPDTAANVPAIAAKEWFQGRNVPPKLMAMDGNNNNNDVNVALRNKLNQQQSKTDVIVSPKHVERKSNSELITNLNVNVKATNGINNKNNNDDDDDNKTRDNNSKKFAFLSQQTIPDYRPQVK